jgi:tetratricopeptide (TPR) repeat protein
MKNILYIFTIVLTTTAIAQNSSSIAFEKEKLQMAKSYADENMIANSIYSIIALEGPQSVYKDSLAYVYFNQRKFISCFLVTDNILSYKPNDVQILELSAISLESMGALEKAKETFMKLVDLTKDNYQAYKLASIEYKLKQFDAAYATIKRADQLSGDNNLEVTFQINENYNQNVNIKAAIAYLQGLIEVSLNKNAEAKVSFERAIKIFPEFVLAKSKLEILNAQKTPENN